MRVLLALVAGAIIGSILVLTGHTVAAMIVWGVYVGAFLWACTRPARATR